MARTTKRTFWSFITRRRGDSPRAVGQTPQPGGCRWRRRLTLERLEDLTLPSVSYAPDPVTQGVRAHSLQVFAVTDGQIRHCVTFADPAVLDLFGLPAAPPDRAPEPRPA